MKTYELVVIFRPELDAKKDSLLKNLQDILSKEDITIASGDWWGKKSLAYEITKQRSGLYLYCILTSTNVKIGAVIDTLVKTDDTIMRHLLILKEEKPKKTKDKELRTKN